MIIFSIVNGHKFKVIIYYQGIGLIYLVKIFITNFIPTNYFELSLNTKLPHVDDNYLLLEFMRCTLLEDKSIPGTP